MAPPTPSPPSPPTGAPLANAPPARPTSHRVHPQAQFRVMLSGPSDRFATPAPSRADSDVCATSPDSASDRDGKRLARDLLEKRNEVGPKLVIFMVGLPARGKSYICQKLKRYLSWMGFRTKVFNVGSKRRQVAKEEIATSDIVEAAEQSTASDGNGQANGVSADGPSAAGQRRHPLAKSWGPDEPASGSAVSGEASTSSAAASNSGANVSSPASGKRIPIRSRTKSGASIAIRRNSDNAPQVTAHHDASFFDPTNAEANRKREELAMDSLEEILTWLHSGAGKVAIHDATNTTIARRRALVDRVSRESDVRYMFIESVCTDDEILAQNIKMKLQSPDYVGMAPEQAIADFQMRMANYEKAYEAIGPQEEKEGISYIKIENVGKKVTSYNVNGYLAAQVVLYLINMHIKSRFIYLTRHGESQFNLEGRVGGDPPLTEAGRRYAAALARFFAETHPPRPDVPFFDELPGDEGQHIVHIWTSRLKRTTETAEFFDDRYDVTPMRLLNEIYSGICEGMNYDEIQKVYPTEFKLRQGNKLIGRFPGGESYLDVIERLRPIIVELERMSQSVLIVTHNVIMRTLLAYFTGMVRASRRNGVAFQLTRCGLVHSFFFRT